MSSPIPSIILGCLVTVLGVMGVIQWWPQVVVFVKGGLAVSLVFAGIIAVAAGISRYTIRGEDDHHGSSHRPPHEDSKK